MTCQCHYAELQTHPSTHGEFGEMPDGVDTGKSYRPADDAVAA